MTRFWRGNTHSIVDVRTDDETFLSSLYSMANCDDVSWLKEVAIKGRDEYGRCGQIQRWAWGEPEEITMYESHFHS